MPGKKTGKIVIVRDQVLGFSSHEQVASNKLPVFLHPQGFVEEHVH